MSEASVPDEHRRPPFGLPMPKTPPRQALDALLGTGPDADRRMEIGIPMRDGVELAADVFLPPSSQGPAPAVVIGTPYDKSSPVDDIRFFSEAGYISVSYDIRGRGKSEGEWAGHPNDADDGHDVVEWVAAQEWCDGKVGVTGLSYSGYVVWATMSRRPPHLCAAISISASGRFTQEVPYTYGCMWLYYVYWFAFVRRRINDESRDVGALLDTLPVRAIGEALGVSGPAWNDFLEHDTLDSYWRGLRWDGRYDFDLPVLHVTGWHDREDIQGAFHHYEQMVATSPARDRQWLLAGPWSHVSCRFPSSSYAGVETPDAALDMEAIQIRFFDRFLRGEENGVAEEPRVQMYDPGASEWKVRERWGLPVVQKVDLFLTEGRALATAPGPGGQDGYEYDPERPSGIRFDPDAPLWEPPLDLAELESQPGVITWTGEALEEAMTLHGWGELELYATTDGEDTDWHVKLTDVQPDGRSLAVGWGCLRASYRESLSDPKPVAPGVVTRYAIELTPAFHTFRPGHRLRVVLCSADYPWFARNLNRFGPIADQEDPRVARNTVHRGAAYPSRLRLPIEQARR